MEELSKLLNEYAKAYYEQDKMIVTDAQYDALFDELISLEKETGIILDSSPTNRVGGEPLKKFESHKHMTRLMSLDKCKSTEELLSWEKRIKKIINDYEVQEGEKLPQIQYSLEYKFDGITINLTYQDGKLVQAATRGNGITGEAILPQVKSIYTIPLVVDFAGLMEVRGEGIMKLSTLKKYNETAKDPLKNARNGAAGALRNLDPKVTKSRHLDAFFYQITTIEGLEIANHDDMRAFISDMNLPMNDYYKAFDSIEDLAQEIVKVEDKIPKLDYLVDGMVIKVVDHRLRDILGATNRFPRWAMAYKFEAQEVSTKLLSVTWQVGRTGRLTPVAELEACDVGGVTVKRATLNNFGDMLRKKVKIGSNVILRRSNDVIPEIMGVLDDENYGEQIPIITNCPACNHEVKEVGAHLYCPNSLSCPAQVVSKIAHYASRDAMDIETLSEKTAQTLHDELGLAKLSDLYNLKKEELLQLDGFKEKKAQNIIDAIEDKKQVELGRFIYALGISNVGKKTAYDLAEYYMSLDNLMNATHEELVGIRDVGDIVAQSVIDFVQDEETIRTIKQLQTSGVNPIEIQKKQSSIFEGKTFVITGTLDGMTRREVGDIIKQNGGDVSSSVSKNTDYLLAGENAGSKLTKAQSLEVTIITLDEFKDML
ncbi:MAG: NAD-dependent DNA ligase LigA [Clostridiales bacterium]|nr:NAD-dependent DNA ligase LigA [Clostridiales bacterium]